jgi:hypothetical protein
MKKIAALSAFVCASLALFTAHTAAQTRGAVPLDDAVYFFLEQAELRALIPPLPTVKPYQRSFVLKTLDGILASESGRALSDGEKAIVNDARKRFLPTEEGINWRQGTYAGKTETQGGTPFTVEIGVDSDLLSSGAVYFEGNGAHGAMDERLSAHIAGDLSSHISYNFLIGLSLLYVERPEWEIPVNVVKGDVIKKTFGEPPAFFPFSYRSRWDGFVFNTSDLSSSGPTGWPVGFALGFTSLAEIAGSALDDKLTFRFGRLEREWGSMAEGSSLVLNKLAQPFFALEATINPFSWFGFSSLTGFLEYYDAYGIQGSSATFQNIFSIMMIELNYKNYLHLDFGDTAVWPKRFELGYLFPLIGNMLYQNNVGDFDNIGLFADLKLQKPGLGSVWLSVFVDEINFESNFFSLDREMYAYQAGAKVNLPWISFGTLTLSYTKVEPYCYTHITVDKTPWYNGLAMEEAYMNHGYGLGHYLPPNSDEVRLRFDFAPRVGTMFNAQFQMIRHGADHGSSMVDGSSYVSELDGDNRSGEPKLRKYFLHDGAYQWFHIIKAGAKHRLSNYPIEFSLEAGFVFSYWTNIDGPANDGASHAYHISDSAEYPKQNALIATLGVKVFK